MDKPIKPRKYVKKKISSQENSIEKEQEVVYTGEIMEQNVEELVDCFKNQYLSMIHQMQGSLFIHNMETLFKKERSRRDLLFKRVGQLETQIGTLVQESLVMLKYSLKELGIEASNPTQFIEKAKEIVCR